MWLHWCILSTVISGFTAIAVKKSSNNDSKRMVITGLFVYHLIMIVTSLLIHPEFITKLNGEDCLEMLPGLTMQAIGFYCFISSIKYGKVAITTPIRKCNVVMVFILGIFVLKEDCTVLQVIVSGILIFLSIIIGKQKNDNTIIDKKLERKAILFAYGYVICNGISKTLNKVYVTQFENPLYVVFTYGIITIIAVLIYCLVTKKWDYIDIRKINNRGYFLLQSLCDASSSIFTRFAMLTGNVSVISVIETSSIVITLLASRIILKEKISWKKYLMIAGIFLCVLILTIIK